MFPEQHINRLHNAVRRCRKCPLHRSRTHAVPGEGPVSADVIFIGEAPGKEEDRQGRPFVGRSGGFLDVLLKGIGLSRRQVYITSAVKCRPPRNRSPHADELRICKANWLDKQISLVNPKVVILLGKISLKQMLGLKSNLTALHGRVFAQNGRSCFATFHPAAATRFPQIKMKMERDFKILKKLMSRPRTC